MNLTELADLVKISEYLKNFVSTSGLNRFSRNDEVALKKKLSELESKFVSEVLALDLVSTAATIQNAIKEAKEKMLVSSSESNTVASAAKFLDKEAKQLKNLPSTEKVKAGQAINEKAAKIKKEKAVEVVQPTPTMEEEQKREEVQLELPTAATPSSTSINPYTEDESIAAMLAAEKQKIAAKKRKTS